MKTPTNIHLKQTRLRTLSRADAWGNPTKSLLLCACLLISNSAVGQVSTFTPLSGGTFDWNLGSNWSSSPSIPNGIGAIANIQQNITGNTTINLNGSYTVGQLNVGDSNGSHTLTILPGTVPGSIITIDQSGGLAGLIVKSGGALVTIGALIDLNAQTLATVGSGTLLMSGGLTIGGPDPRETLEKLGGGALTISGPLTITADSGGVGTLTDEAILQLAGTLNIEGGTNSIARTIRVEAGTLNFGSAANASSTTFTPSAGLLRITGGTTNIGVTTTAANINTNLTIDMDRIDITGGTLNLSNRLYGTAAGFIGSGTTGTTTLTAGASSTLTLDGGTTTLYRADGVARGAVVFPSNSKLVLNGSANFNFTDNLRTNTQTNVTTTNNSATINMTDTSGINVGDTITGTNIQSYTRVDAINPGVSITLSRVATGSGGITNLSVFNEAKNTTLAGLNSTSNDTVLRSQAGAAILKVGGDGIADVFNGRLDLSGSSGSSRLQKLGTEVLSIGGTLDNSSARIEVLEGTVLLNKASSATVHAVSALLIGETIADGGNPETVQIGGTYVGTGSSTGGNYRDQIFRGAEVFLNGGAILDLRGFQEGFNTAIGTGIIQSSVAGGVVNIGENNPGTFTFDGTLIDGGGTLSFIKSGSSGDMNLTGSNTYTGTTTVARNNLILIGANGAISGTSEVNIERFGQLRINNNTNINNNRVSDTAAFNMNGGELRYVRNSVAGASGNTSETFGSLNLKNSNVIRFDHTNLDAGSSSIANVIQLNFASYNRVAGGTVQIFDQVANSFLTTTPQSNNSRLTFTTLPSASLIGTTIAGTTTTAVDTKILLGAYGGTGGGSVGEFMTVETVAGVHYARPVRANEGNTSIAGTQSTSNIPRVAGTGTYDDNLRTQNVSPAAPLTFNENAAFNSWRHTGTAATGGNTFIAEGKVLYLGGLAANPGNNIALDGSGMILLTGSAGLNILGGRLDFNSREAIIRTDQGNENNTLSATLTNNSTVIVVGNNQGMTVGDRVTGTNIPANAEIVAISGNNVTLNVTPAGSGSIGDFRTFNRNVLDSIVTGSGGFTKTGGNIMDVTGMNQYLGVTTVNDGELRIFQDKGLGAAGAGNGTVVSASRILSLNSGINVVGESLDLLGNSFIQTLDRNNNWDGDIIINPTDASGNNVNMTFRAQGNGVLTVNGTVTTPLTNVAKGYFGSNPTFNNEGESQQFILENYAGAGGIMNFNGKISDINGGSAVAGAAHDELNIIVRGYTGQTNATNNDFVVNLNDVASVNGRLEVRSGIVNVGSDYGGNNPIATRGATIRLTDGGNVDRTGSFGGLFLNTAGTTFKGGQINVGENTGSFSSKSVALIGTLANSGTVTFGTDSGSIDLNPVAGTNDFNSATNATINSTIAVSSSSTGAVGNGVSTITMGSVAGLAVGQGISGPGIPANTRINNIVGNDVILSQNTNAATTAVTNYTYHRADVSSVDIGNNVSVLTLSSTAGLAVGQGISGAGIPAGTKILGIDTILNEVTLDRRTNSAQNAGTVYSFYNPSVNTVTLASTAGLSTGMGISGTGIPAGAIIKSISGNVVTLTAELQSFAGSNTTYALPSASVQYNTAVTATSGATSLTFFSANGLSPGTPISGTGIPTGTFIGAITGDVVTLVNGAGAAVATTAQINGNTAINVRKVSNFAESRLYAAEGGTVDFKMRIIDDGGFSLQNEVGAVTKVGRGTVELSGSGAGASDVDGGFNLFGGQLTLSYDNAARGNSRVNGGNAAAPYQLTLGGGDLFLRDDESRATTESFRGTFTIRPGDSLIKFGAENSSLITLNLGPNNDFHLDSAPEQNWREPNRYAGGTAQIYYNDSNGAGQVFYSKNAPQGGVGGNYGAGYSSINPYITLRLSGSPAGDHVDFSYYVPVAATTGQLGTDTFFGDAEGVLTTFNRYVARAPDVTQWNNFLNGSGSIYGFGEGYLTDADTTVLNQGFTGTLASNGGASGTLATDFIGARVIRFAGAVANNTLNLNTRIVLGSNGDSGTTGLPFGTAMRDGGAILISDLTTKDVADPIIGTPVARDQFLKGGSITSAYQSTYFDGNTVKGPTDTSVNGPYNATDLIVHNYNRLGTFHVESQVVNYQSAPLNLVLSGPGTAHLNPTTGSNPYTGITYINDSTLWVSDGSRFGSSTGAVYMNGGTLEFANDTNAGRNTTAVSPTLATTRDIILGGDGGRLKTTAAGTTLTYGGIIRSEDNILPVQLAQHRLETNYGVGDFIKEGLGRLILTNTTALGTPGANRYYGTTEVDEGVLQLNINNVNSGILGSNEADFDRTIVGPNGRLALQITGGVANGTNEWIELSGGILETTATHTGGTLNGVMKVTANSTVDIVGTGTLRFNAEAGYMTGDGDLTKLGTGTLVLMENNPDFTGDWNIVNGRVVGRSQGTPLGSGASISLGDTTAAASGVAELFLHSRTTGATFNPNETFNTEYGVSQNITVNAEGSATQQIKRIGARNYDDAILAGDQFDRFAYNGALTLNDDALLNYTDAVANSRITATGRDQAIALNGAISGTGNLATELVYAGNTANSNNDLRITFELNADNTAWAGDLTTGNATGNLDLQHIVRLGNNNALKSDNDVTVNFNNTLQVGGNDVTMGNLFVTPTGITAGTGAAAANSGLIIENADNVAGKLTITQTTNDQWDILFRDGATPVQYEDQLRPRNNSLSIVKDGAAKAILTQTSTNTGTTLVQTGILQVGDVGSEVASTGRGATTVATGATLAGTGVIGGNPTISGVNLTGTNTIITNDVTGYAVGQVINDPTKFAPGTTVNGIVGNTITLSNPALITTPVNTPTTLATITQHSLNGTLNPGEYDSLVGTNNLVGGLSVQGTLNSIGGTVNFQLDGTTNDAGLALLMAGSPTYTSYLTANVAAWELLKTDANRNSGPNYDFINVSNGLTFDANSLVNVAKLPGSSYNFAAGDVFDLMDWATALNNGLLVGTNFRTGGLGTGDLDLPVLTGSLGWDVSLFQSNGILLVVNVPEPSRLVLAFLGIFSLLLRRNRRR